MGVLDKFLEIMKLDVDDDFTTESIENVKTFATTFIDCFNNSIR